MKDKRHENDEKRTKRCSKCGYTLDTCAVQTCVHTGVRQKYGYDICVNCCRTCKNAVSLKNINGIRCGLKRTGTTPYDAE